MVVSGASFASLAACGDEKKKPDLGGSGAPVDPSKQDPKCTKATPVAVKERCGNGDISCCTQFIEGKLENDPATIDDFGLACKGGHLKACDIVREAEKDFAWKLDVYRASCPRMGHAPCRNAVFLAALVDPKGLDADLKLQCEKEKEGIQLASRALACGQPVGSLAELQPILDACNQGTFAACKRLADFDGNAATMMQMSLRPLWLARGVAAADLDAVFAGRLAPPDGMAALAPTGKVTVKVTGAKPVAPAFGDALGKRTDELRKCVALGDPKEDKKGSVKFDVVLGRGGEVLLTSGVDASTTPAIADCMRFVAQTTAGGEPGRAKVELSFTR